MFPSLAALGGTLGLLGLREPELLGSENISNLNSGYQRHIDSCPVDYAALMRDPWWGHLGSPIARLVGDPPTATVALIGGGIANIIAAYELSRVGIRCTVYEATERLGGRLYSNREKTTSTAWSEGGAVRFPRGGLMWHYVAQWVRSVGLDPETAGIQANSFPSPGTVPTMLAYQGESYGWDLDDLPPIVREARALFADFIAGINDGTSDPGTVYFADAVRMLKAEPNGETTQLLKKFWESILKQYDGRSFAEVLQTEAFANGSNLPDLMAAFGTLGVGTGGFSHLYDAAFLEVLRVLLWDIHGEFMLPEQYTNPQLFAPDEGGAQGFAMGLARAALQSAQNFYPQMTFDDMFKVNAPVERIWGDSSPGLWIEFQPPRETVRADVVIVGMTSRAMQMMQLDLPYEGSPFLLPLSPPPEPPPQVTDFVRPSCRAAIKRLDVVPGYRMNTELNSPNSYEEWPEDSFDNKIMCFVTDTCARLAYVLPEVPPDEGLVRVTVAEAYGSDADKFKALPDSRVRRQAAQFSFAYGLQADGAGGDGPAEAVATLINLADVNDVVWSFQPRVQGAFKVDKPGDNYFSSSLFYHYQLAQPKNLRSTDVFLSGDSVGHLGGWVEGAAMSAINAAVGACSRLEQRYPSTLRMEDRFAALLESDVNLFHRWVSISGRAPRKSGLSSMVRLGNWETDPALPPRWRYLGKTTGEAFEMVNVSKPGDFMVAAIDGGLWFNTRGSDGPWGDLRPVTGTEGFVPVRSIAVATEKGNSQAQLIIVGSDGLMWYGTYDDGVWSEFTRPWGNMKLKQAALDVESGNAQVVARDHSDRLGHGIRLTDGTWSILRFPPSPAGDPVFFVLGAADSCTSAKQDLTTIAAIDRGTSSVYVAIRDGQHGQHGIWGQWVQLPSPRPPGAEAPLRAVKVRVVVLDDANNAQVWAQFTDGSTTPDRLYSSARDTVDQSGLTWTTFQPVPYPLSGAAGPVVDFAPTLPHDSLLEPDLPDLSTVVYAQIGANLDADQPDEDEVTPW